MRFKPLKFRKIIIFLCFAIILLFFLSKSLIQYFYIKTVYVEGSDGIKIDLSAFDEHVSIFSISIKQISENILNRNPMIKTLTLTKKYPDAIFIKIIKRQIKYFMNQGSQIYYFDEDGIFIKDVIKKDTNKLVEINCNLEGKITSMKIDDNNLINILKLIDNVKQSSDLSINYMRCQEGADYQMRINGVLVTVKSDIKPELTVSSLQVLFKQFKIEGRTPKVIDLRFTKPVLKYEADSIDNTGVPDTQSNN